MKTSRSPASILIPACPTASACYFDFHKVSNNVIGVYMRWWMKNSLTSAEFRKEEQRKRATFLLANESTFFNLQQRSRRIIINLISCCSSFIRVDKSFLYIHFTFIYLFSLVWKNKTIKKQKHILFARRSPHLLTSFYKTKSFRLYSLFYTLRYTQFITRKIHIP